MLEYKSLQRANFWKVFSTLITNGVSLPKSFEIAIEWADKELLKMQPIIKKELDKGKTFNRIVAHFDVFSNLETELVNCSNGLDSNNLEKLSKQTNIISELLNTVGLPNNTKIDKSKHSDIYLFGEEKSEIDSDFSEFFNENELKEVGFAEFNKNISNETKDTPVVKFVNYVVFRAISDRVTNITIEAFETHLKIIYFKDDKIVTPSIYNNLPLKLYESAIFHLKKIADGMDSSITNKEQEGYMEIEDATFKVNFNIKTYPTNFGEIINIKINY